MTQKCKTISKEKLTTTYKIYLKHGAYKMVTQLNDIPSCQSIDFLQLSSLERSHALLIADQRIKLDAEQLLEWRKRLKQIRGSDQLS